MNRVSSLILAFAIVIIGIRVQATIVPDDLFLIPREYYPGNPVPYSTYCDWQNAQDSYSCETVDLMRFRFVVKRGIIISTSISVGGHTLGDYVLAWGTPDGVMRGRWLNRVYFGNKSVWTSGLIFPPRSIVFFITISSQRSGVQEWTGF